MQPLLVLCGIRVYMAKSIMPDGKWKVFDIGVLPDMEIAEKRLYKEFGMFM